MITINGNSTININTVDKTDIKHLRNSNELKEIKKLVKIRDGGCVLCGDKDSQLEIHHILPISEYPSLALDCKNLITLCQKCHRRYHDKYDGNIGAESLIKYAGEF